MRATMDIAMKNCIYRGNRISQNQVNLSNQNRIRIVIFVKEMQSKKSGEQTGEHVVKPLLRY